MTYIYTSEFKPDKHFVHTNIPSLNNMPCSGVRLAAHTASSRQRDPLKAMVPGVGAHLLGNGMARCEFDLDLFDHPEQLLDYHELFSAKDASYDSVVKKLLTTTSFDACPINPDTLRPYETCMPARRTDEVGDLFRAWGRAHPGELDKYRRLFCDKNLNHPDCSCLNRGLIDESYKILKPGAPYHDSCWYVPCVPSSGRMTLEEEPSCATVNVCSISMNFVNNNNVSLKNVVGSNNCRQGVDSASTNRVTVKPPPLPTAPSAKGTVTHGTWAPLPAPPTGPTAPIPAPTTAPTAQSTVLPELADLPQLLSESKWWIAGLLCALYGVYLLWGAADTQPPRRSNRPNSH